MNTDTALFDARRNYRIAVSSLFFLSGLCFSSWAARIPSIQHELQLNDAGLGAVLLSLPVGLMVSLPLAGWLVAKFGSRIIVISSAILYALVLPFIGFAQQTWQLMGVLFMFGLSGNLLNIAMNTQGVGVEAIYGRSILASFHGIWSLAGFTGAAIGTFMISQHIAPYHHFLIVSAIALLIVLCAWSFTLATDANAQVDQPIFAKPDKSLLNLGIIAFCCMICEGAMFDWSGVYFQNVVKAKAAWIGAGYTAFMSTMAAGRFVADWLVTRFGIKRVLQTSGVVIAAGLSVAIIFPDISTSIAGFVLVGAGVSSVVPLVYSAAGKSKKVSPGVALAAVSTIGYLGFLIGPPVIGFIAQASSLRISFILIAVLGLTTTLVASKTKW
ncbi:MAG: MFS transporter [Chitinophagaceae bacterium]|nr:MFS transporter [Chitinophagaceae bacterium]